MKGHWSVDFSDVRIADVDVDDAGNLDFSFL